MIASSITASTAGHGVDRTFPRPPSSLSSDRRGRLRNGARPGDFLAAPRCGARTRCGGSCRQPAMHNGRCRMHGGLSTGPRTPEGRARCARARLTHGGNSAATRALRVEARAWTRRIRGLVALTRRPATAGHGVHHRVSRIGASGARPTTAAAASNRLMSAAKGKRRLPLPPSAPGTASPIAGEARHHPSSVNSVSSVVNPSTAGHGVLPPFSLSTPSPRALHLLAGAAALAPFSAGHGVLARFSAAPVVRSTAA